MTTLDSTTTETLVSTVPLDSIADTFESPDTTNTSTTTTTTYVPPTKKRNTKTAQLAPKKPRNNLGLEMSPETFENEPFTEAQIQIPGYYDTPGQHQQQEFFEPSYQYYGGGPCPQQFYGQYEPTTPMPQSPFCGTFPMPASKKRPPANRRRDEFVRHRKLQRFGSSIFCDQCDANATFDGSELKIKICPCCLKKSGTAPM